MTSSSDSAHRAQGTQPRVCEGPQAQGPRRTLWAPKFTAEKAELVRRLGEPAGGRPRERAEQAPVRVVTGCWFGSGEVAAFSSPPLFNWEIKYRCRKCVPPVPHARGGERQAPLTVGPVLCLLWATSFYLHLCLYLVPAPKAHNPLIRGQSKHCREVCVLQGGMPVPFPRVKETDLRTPLGAQEWVLRVPVRTPRAGGLSGEEAADLNT